MSFRHYHPPPPPPHPSHHDNALMMSNNHNHNAPGQVFGQISPSIHQAPPLVPPPSSTTTQLSSLMSLTQPSSQATQQSSTANLWLHGNPSTQLPQQHGHSSFLSSTFNLWSSDDHDRRYDVLKESFESHIRSIANEINTTIQLHVNGLISRRERLLDQLENIKIVYLSLFENQRSSTRRANSSMNGGLSLLDDSDMLTDPLPQIPSISFMKPDHALYKAITSMGFLTSPAFAPYCTASGDGLEAAIPGQNMSFIIFTKNCFNEELLVGREAISVRIIAFVPNGGSANSSLPHSRSGTLNSISANELSQRTSSFGSGSSVTFSTLSPTPLTPNGLGGSGSNLLSSPNSSSSLMKIPCPSTIVDHNNGKYTVTYSLPQATMTNRSLPSDIEITVLVNGFQIPGCPFIARVQTQQKQSWRRVLTYGSEGKELGQFCRPWGVKITRMPVNFSIPSPSRMISPNEFGSDQHSLIELGDQQQHPVIVTAGTTPSPVSSMSQSLPNSSSTTSSPNANQPLPSDLTLLLNASPTLGGLTLGSGRSESSSSTSLKSGSSATSGGTQYLLAVADRSNNRIQLLRLDYNSTSSISISPLFAFGSGPGTREGQFDRPAGLCFNMSLGHIIVTDKDNHRVQVFDLAGRYLFNFGEKGNRAGQFCYPWDVESCQSTSQIIVSDTRNRRVQVFTSFGQYLMHFAQPLDSPRGVAFFGESGSKILVSDFNKHRLIIFDKSLMNERVPHANGSSIIAHHGGSLLHSNNGPNGTSNYSPMKYIGFGEGSGWGEFLRPQGVAISGNYAFCSDSRNNRICLYNLATHSFDYIGSCNNSGSNTGSGSGGSGNSSGSLDDLGLDRPSGIAVIDNIMIIVDFGNNRLQVCSK